MPSKDTLYRKFHDHLTLLQSTEWASKLQGDYICPLCLALFYQQAITIDALTLEHAPQNALGGRIVALTCRDCNNDAGREVDCHLDNLVQQLEFQHQESGSKREGHFIDASGRRVQGILEYDNGNCLLKLSEKNNNPKIDLGSFSIGEEFSFEGKRVKYNVDCATAAILKNAYILLFARIGYTILTDRFYNLLRNYINNPTKCFLPKPLYRICPSLPINDGVFLFQMPQAKGFFVVYSVTKQTTMRILVLIPAICSSYQKVATFLRAMHNIKLCILPNDDAFLTNVDKMNKLLRWSKSKTMQMHEIFE